jgi:hypothetical protein
MSSTAATATPTTATTVVSTWKLDPLPLGGRVQGKTHDDLVREG